jgi:hypothetical protein
MAEGIALLRKIILGRETTAGTEADGTTIWRGKGVLTNPTAIVFPEEHVGYLSGITRSYISKLEATISLEETEATFEQLPHIFEMGVKTVAAAQDGTEGSGYTYTYALPTTAVNTCKTYTLEAGDNIQEEQMLGVFCESFSLSGSAGGALMMSAELRGKQVSTGTYTTTATLPAVEEILFSSGKLYIDAVSGTAGTTQVSNTLIDATLNVTTGFQAVWTADGSLAYSFVKQTGAIEVTLDVTFEHNATSVAQKAAALSETPKLLVLTFEGSNLTTSGTYSKKTFKITLAGQWDKPFDGLSDTDGNNTVAGTFRARYDPTAATFGSFLVVNELSALP